MNNRIILKEIKKLREDIKTESRYTRYWNITTFIFSIALVVLSVAFTFLVSNFIGFALMYFYAFIILMVVDLIIIFIYTLFYKPKKKRD